MPLDERRTWVAKYYPSFNGLRGMAILLVFANHYGSAAIRDVYVHQLWFGVDIFFVLSGFLITGILYDSKGEGSFFRNFYVRRTLRIFPLYYGAFLLLYAVAPFAHFVFQPYFWTNLLYVSNIVRLYVNPSYATYVPNHQYSLIFGHIWSLCVEEQFYLLWPMIVWALPDRKAMMRFAAGAAVVSLLLRIFLYFRSPAAVAATGYLYWITPTRTDGLFMGAWVALWLRGTRLTRSELRKTAYRLILPCVAILVVGAATIGRRWTFDERNPLLATYGYSLVDLTSVGLLLLALDEQGLLAKALNNQWLKKIGTISYGLYFFHGIYKPALFALRDRYADVPHSGLIFLVAAFALNLLVAALSYNLYERHFLKLKDILAPGHKSIPSGKEVGLARAA